MWTGVSESAWCDSSSPVLLSAAGCGAGVPWLQERDGDTGLKQSFVWAGVTLLATKASHYVLSYSFPCSLGEGKLARMPAFVSRSPQNASLGH